MNLAIANNNQKPFANSSGRPASKKYYLHNGIEVPSVSSFQMREIERLACDTGTDSLHMTERAGLALALLAVELLGRNSQRARILVLGGAGGGTQAGICAARHLSEMRWNVKLCLSNPPFAGQLLSYQHRIFESIQGEEINLWNLHEQKPDLIIDALLDYRGSEKPAKGNIPGMIRWANSTGAMILSQDVPSGIDPTTGDVRGDFIRPQWTLTTGLPKTGLCPESAGELFLADIGLRPETIRRSGINYLNPFKNELWVPLTCEADIPRLDW